MYRFMLDFAVWLLSPQLMVPFVMSVVGEGVAR